MMARATVAAALTAGLAIAPAFAAETRVSFLSPERFTDLDTDGSSLTTEATLDRICRILADLGRRLPADQRLDLEVRDVDLAGFIPPRRPGASATRVMNDGTRPAMRIGYRLSRGGRVLASGEDFVSDPTYLMNATARYAIDTLRYEQIMLERWFDRQFRTFG